jgi:type II secretory pathway pseudopilin PulG
MKTKLANPSVGNGSKAPTPARPKAAQAAFSLVEVTIGMGVVGTAALALFSGFTSGFFTMQLARENLRATQVLLEKTETLRLYSWDQINTPGYIPTTFTAFYDPNDTNANSSIVYSGTMVVTNCPMSTTYSDDMKMAVITLNWRTGNLERSRSFTTYIARNGLQTYIY